MLKKILLFVVLPALITGVFAFLPTLYEQWKQPKAILTYEVTVGPEVKSDSGAFRIGSIVVRNAGSKRLAFVKAEINLSNATLQAFSTDNDDLIGVKAEPKPNAILFSAASLLPGDKFSATFLMHAAGEVPLPTIAVRSDEIRGSPPIVERKRDSWDTGLTGAVLGALSVMVMVLFTFYRLTKTERTTFGQVLRTPTDKQDLIRYIATRAGVDDFGKHPEVAGKNISYLRSSDILLGIAGSDASKETACALACRALLLIDKVSEISMQLIVRNVENIEGDDSIVHELELLRSRVGHIAKPVEMRETIDAFLQGPAAFLTTP